MLRLPYRKGIVSFDFVALHYKDPEKNRYRYRLEGFNPDWVEAGTQHTANYTRLPPGNYVFAVQAANSDGVWSDAGLSIPLGGVSAAYAGENLADVLKRRAEQIRAPGYTIPPRLREQVVQRDRTCVFPRCTRPARDAFPGEPCSTTPR
mgnify:CR=1 FL=1